MDQRPADLVFTVAFLGGFVWLAFALGGLVRFDFPWDALQLLLASAGVGAGVSAWLMAREQRWASAAVRVAGFLTALITWTAWVPPMDLG